MSRDEHRTPPGGTSFTELAAPVFAGFSLPAIIVLVTSSNLKSPWRNITLYLLVIATSLFMASIGLSADPIKRKFRRSGLLRGSFSLLGIFVAAGALYTLGYAVINHAWAWVVFLPLLIGSGVPAGIAFFYGFKEESADKKARQEAKEAVRACRLLRRLVISAGGAQDHTRIRIWPGRRPPPPPGSGRSGLLRRGARNRWRRCDRKGPDWTG
jgi:hypothetical protein